MLVAGLEPARVASLEPKSSVSANFTISALYIHSAERCKLHILVNTRPQEHSQERVSFYYAGDRDRTGTSIATRGILSPVRLPVPPHRQNEEWTLGDSNPGPTGYEPVALTN